MDWGGLALVVAGLLGLYALLPMSGALAFGGDEGVELEKGLMCRQGYRLYREIWNDQPPVLTHVVAAAFRLGGVSFLTGRLVAAGYGVVFLGAFFCLARREMPRWEAVSAAFLLVSGPLVLGLCSGLVLEVPAIGTGLVSAALAWGWRERWGWKQLLLSGAVMGVALQTKLTSVVVIPAALAMVGVKEWERSRSVKEVGRVWGAWGAGALLLFSVIGLTWAGGSLTSSWHSHFNEHRVLSMGKPEDYPVQMALFRYHAEGVAWAVAGTVWVLFRRRWREFVFPLTMLATVTVVHAVNRPWWDYYYLHFAVPLGWLGGSALMGAGRRMAEWLSETGYSLMRVRTWGAIGLGLAVGWGVMQAGTRLEENVKSLRQSPRADQDPIVAKLQEHGKASRWAYSEEESYLFAAGLLVPPELTIIPIKRYWSGQLTPREVVELCRRYQVGQLLLKPDPGVEWMDLLPEYEAAYKSPARVLFVRKRGGSSE
jgi:hypothetical protein